MYLYSHALLSNCSGSALQNISIWLCGAWHLKLTFYSFNQLHFAFGKMYSYHLITSSAPAAKTLDFSRGPKKVIQTDMLYLSSVKQICFTCNFGYFFFNSKWLKKQNNFSLKHYNAIKISNAVYREYCFSLMEFSF